MGYDITVQPGPSQNYFQAHDYRILPPEADADTVAEGDGISLSTLPLNCDILVPTDGDHVAGRCADHPRLGDRRRRPRVERVDVSLDDGHPGVKPTCTPRAANGHGGVGRSPSTSHRGR